MSSAPKLIEKTCPACGLLFAWRNVLDIAWRDHRYCSSSCQRRASSTGSGSNTGRPTRFPEDTRSIDRHR
ncbi:MAG: DUF2256 domain-containing protein [Woeseia sp.]